MSRLKETKESKRLPVIALEDSDDAEDTSNKSVKRASHASPPKNKRARGHDAPSPKPIDDDEIHEEALAAEPLIVAQPKDVARDASVKLKKRVRRTEKTALQLAASVEVVRRSVEAQNESIDVKLHSYESSTAKRLAKCDAAYEKRFGDLQQQFANHSTAIDELRASAQKKGGAERFGELQQQLAEHSTALDELRASVLKANKQNDAKRFAELQQQLAEHSAALDELRASANEQYDAGDLQKQLAEHSAAINELRASAGAERFGDIQQQLADHSAALVELRASASQQNDVGDLPQHLQQELAKHSAALDELRASMRKTNKQSDAEVGREMPSTPAAQPDVEALVERVVVLEESEARLREDFFQRHTKLLLELDQRDVKHRIELDRRETEMREEIRNELDQRDSKMRESFEQHQAQLLEAFERQNALQHEREAKVREELEQYKELASQCENLFNSLHTVQERIDGVDEMRAKLDSVVEAHADLRNKVSTAATTEYPHTPGDSVAHAASAPNSGSRKPTPMLDQQQPQPPQNDALPLSVVSYVTREIQLLRQSLEAKMKLTSQPLVGTPQRPVIRKLEGQFK